MALSARTWFTLLLSLSASAGGNVMLKGTLLGIQGGAPAGGPVELALTLLSTPGFWLGLCLYGTGFLLWIMVLASEQISRVYPIGASLSFLLILAASSHFFGERYSIVSLAGVVLILAGIVICSTSEESHAREDPP